MNFLNNEGNGIKGNLINKLVKENEGNELNGNIVNQLSKRDEENKLNEKNDEYKFRKKKEENMLNEKCEEKEQYKKDNDLCKKDSCKQNNNVIFSNITLCLMGMSSVILYNYVLNTTPHIHALLNKNIMISFTFFLYFFVLVVVSLVSSLFLEVEIITYDICFISSFILHLLYPFIVKYYYHRTFFFYFLISCIGAVCSFLKTMIFSIASIVLNNSKVICLSYGITGIYSFSLTSLFYYFIIKVEKNIQKLQLSLFITSAINCTLILCSFICYTFLKKTENFKRKFKIYSEERKYRKGYGIYHSERISEQKTVDVSYSINIIQEYVDNRDCKNHHPYTKNESSTQDKKKKEENKNTENSDNKKKEQFILGNVHHNKPVNNNKNNTTLVETKNKLFNKFFLLKINMKEYLNKAKFKTNLYKKAFISLFCIFYNIFLKVLVFPVVCPEIWTKNVDERYILIGIVQVADCVSRIFPTIAESYPIFKFFILPQKIVLLCSVGRTCLSLLCIIIPLTKIPIFHNFIFKCVLIFTNIYMNGWFVILSFINIPNVLKPLYSLSNAAIVSSFGSTLLRIGLLTGYGASTIYKYFVTRFLI